MVQTHQLIDLVSNLNRLLIYTFLNLEKLNLDNTYLKNPNYWLIGKMTNKFS